MNTKNVMLRTSPPAMGAGRRFVLYATTLGWGGTERYVEDLAIEYARRGIDPLVIVDTPPLVRYPKIAAAGVDVRVLDIPADIDEDAYCAKLKETLQIERAGFVHANVWMRWPWIKRTCAQNDIPCVKTNHCTTALGLRTLVGLTHPRKCYNAWASRRQAARIRPEIISISDLSCRGLRRFHRDDVRTTRVYLGVRPPAVRSRPADRGDGPVFVWIGSLIPRKRPLMLLSAFAAISRDFPEARLVIAGDGPMRKDVENSIRDNMLQSVDLLGFTHNIEEVLAAGQILLLTSNDEGMPYVILEAMAAGMPVIATNCGAVPEAVSDGVTGLVVPANGTRALIKAMRTLTRDPELRRTMGQAGHERWKNTFTLGRMVDNTLEAYAVLTSRQAAPANEAIK